MNPVRLESGYLVGDAARYGCPCPVVMILEYLAVKCRMTGFSEMCILFYGNQSGDVDMDIHRNPALRFTTKLPANYRERIKLVLYLIPGDN